MDKPEFQHLPPWKWAAKHPWGAAAAAAACASVMICISVLLGMEGSSAWMLSVVILPVVFLLVVSIIHLGSRTIEEILTTIKTSRVAHECGYFVCGSDTTNAYASGAVGQLHFDDRCRRNGELPLPRGEPGHQRH
jgi:hypothetical protein